MASTTYRVQDTVGLARQRNEVADELAAAQARLDQHLRRLGGRCITCESDDCLAQESATRTFMTYLALPRRRPSATQPERASLRRVAGGRTWL